jgi:hypothetical protein
MHWTTPPGGINDSIVCSPIFCIYNIRKNPVDESTGKEQYKGNFTLRRVLSF